MVTKRVLHFTDARYFDEPTGQELIFMILNYTFCIPVLLAVGGFSIYHFYMMSGNSTTIEGWEKDKAATLVRRGKIKEIKFPYNLGMRRNIASVLGDNPWLWCWPTKPSGTGLKYQLAEGHDPSSLDEDWPPKDPSTYNMPETDPNYVLQIPDSPWTYNNGTLNPSFLAGSSGSVRKRKVNNRVSHVPPYHPDFGKPPPPGDSDASWDDTSEEEEAEDESSSPPRFNDGYEYSETPSGIRKRRGSEGYEVGPIDRVALLRQHVAETTAEPGRYNWYLPTRDYDIESSDSENEDVPLVNGSGNGTEVKTS
ncbi:hypothetical protein EUX98_g6523 [Antrodiella citrinella]|uniref:Protein S-acyltransferase n=1 Tax=Antrodiella citrinella TaxID=2447956 RepID=A0A4S4MPK6_9APHY|nr:hypothetical protein EUX98_g6523 [Antrodiella citrinella]